MLSIKYLKLFVLFIFVMGSNHIKAQKNNDVIELAGGVLIDLKNNTLYTSHKTTGIEAIDINTGKVIWHSNDALRPVLIRDNQLIAQDNPQVKGVIKLVSIDTTMGSKISEASIKVSNSVMAKASEGMEHKFNLLVDYENNPSGDLYWQYVYKVAQGMAPQQKMVINNQPSDNSQYRPTSEKFYGQIKLDSSNSLSKKDLLSHAKSTPLNQSKSPIKKAIEGKFIPNISGRQFLSLSKKHVLISQLNKTSNIWRKYKWNIYDKDRQQLLTSFDQHNSYRPFVVTNDHVVFITLPAMNTRGKEIESHPFRINVFSTLKGKEMWTREIKDHSYQGPMPH